MRIIRGFLTNSIRSNSFFPKSEAFPFSIWYNIYFHITLQLIRKEATIDLSVAFHTESDQNLIFAFFFEEIGGRILSFDLFLNEN